MKSIFKNIGLVTAGTALAQFITIAFSPVITRIYGPEAFGILGVFSAMLAILAPAINLEYSNSIVLPKKRRTASELFFFALFLSVSVSVILFFGLEILQRALGYTFGLESIGYAPVLVAIGALGLGVLQTFQGWLVRGRLFYIQVKSLVITSLALNISKVLFGLYAPVAIVLVAATAVSYFVNTVLIAFWLRKMGRGDAKLLPPKIHLDIKIVKQISLQYKDFPLYRVPQKIINASSLSLPIMMLASSVGIGAAGFYSLARMVVNAPAAVIGSAVVTVLYPSINDLYNRDKSTERLLILATLALGVVGIIPFGLLIAFGPEIFEFIFGSDWRAAGEYASWLAIWLFFSFMNRPSVASIPVFGMQRFFLIYEVVSLVARLAALYLGFLLFDNDSEAIALFSLVGAILNIYLIIKTWRRARYLGGDLV